MNHPKQDSRTGPFLVWCVLLSLGVSLSWPWGGTPRSALPPQGSVFFARASAGGRVFLERSGDSVREWVNELGSFESRRSEDGHVLAFEWKDYLGDRRAVRFTLSDALVEEARKGFGVRPKARAEWFTSRMVDLPPGLAGVVEAVSAGRGPVHLPDYAVVPPEDYRAFRSHVRDMETGFLRACGFERTRGDLRIDYPGLAVADSESVASAAIAVMGLAEAEGMTWWEAVHLAASLVHMLPYEVPPIVEDGARIFGLWPPAVALVRGAGDCDTKAVLFAAVLQNYRKWSPDIRPAIVLVPGHAFNGLVGWSKRLPMDMVIRDRGADILLLDLTDHSNYPSAGMVHEADRQYLRQRHPEVFRL